MDELFPIAVIRDQVPDGAAKIVQVDAYHKIALFRTGAEYFAMDNRCPHLSAALGDGLFDGTLVECPLHKFHVNVRTGECLTPGYDPRRVFPVTQRGRFAVIHFDAASAAENRRPVTLAQD